MAARFLLMVFAAALLLAPPLPGPVATGPVSGLRVLERPGSGVRAAAPSPSPAAATAARSGAGGRLLIAAIGVNARIEPVGVDPAGNMASPSSPGNVGWYRFGPSPGASGDAVLDGHLDWTSGPAVFWDLHRLAVGDLVVVAPAGAAPIRFRVSTVRSYSAAGRPPPGLFATTGLPRLSLITCAGGWDVKRATYTERLVVDAVLD